MSFEFSQNVKGMRKLSQAIRNCMWGRISCQPSGLTFSC